MTGRSAARRLRVAILGNSVPLLVIPPRQRRSEGSYPEVLEERLRDAGFDATVTNRSRLFDLIHEGSRRYGAEIAPLHPDVVIFNYGVLELQPNVLPTALNRHLSKEIPGGRGLRRLWYHAAVPRLWPLARGWQRWASAKVGLRSWRLPPARFVAELDNLVRIARSTRALVLVVDVHEPGPRLDHFMPGITARWRRFEEELERFVASYQDPDVRLVRVSDIVDSLPGEGTADGLHLTVTAHARLGERLAAEVEEFMQKPESSADTA